MPPKNKIHVSVIQVRQANANTRSETPAEEEEGIIETPLTTGQKTNSIPPNYV